MAAITTGDGSLLTGILVRFDHGEIYTATFPGLAAAGGV